MVALDTYAKKMNPPSIVLREGVHGKVCWLIAYNICTELMKKTVKQFITIYGYLYLLLAIYSKQARPCLPDPTCTLDQLIG